MNTRCFALVLAGLLPTTFLPAQDISSFQNGYLTFTNANSNLFYTVEYRPNLSGPEEWDGEYRVLRDIQSAETTITLPVGVFYRVVARSQPAPSAEVPKTGQTVSYRMGDDGDLERGVAWPKRRFTIITNIADEVVTDNLTGLMWIRTPHALLNNSTSNTWSGAVDFCNALTYGGFSDWRLPSVRELHSLINYENVSDLALPSGHPFVGIRNAGYWSSTTVVVNQDIAWLVYMSLGNVANIHKMFSCYAWPVRGGR